MSFRYYNSSMPNSLPDPSKKAGYVKDVFRRIAPQYDLMNTLMTGGFDRAWKRHVIALAKVQDREQVLDLGAGTGDLARMLCERIPSAHVVAADFSFYMMVAGRVKGNLPFLNCDAMYLPFSGRSFAVILSGYLLRNVADIEVTLHEIYRALRPGGRYVVLDTTRPRKNLLSPLIHFYMHRVIPWLGTLISGSRDAYEYLPDSSENFLTAEQLSEKMREAGFVEISYRRFMFGTVAIHSASKPG